jgi:hypothetical protein
VVSSVDCGLAGIQTCIPAGPQQSQNLELFQNTKRSEDDSIYIIAQDDMVSTLLGKFTCCQHTTNPQNQYVVLGDELTLQHRGLYGHSFPKGCRTDLRTDWLHKENLNQKKLDYASVFIDVIRRSR